MKLVLRILLGLLLLLLLMSGLLAYLVGTTSGTRLLVDTALSQAAARLPFVLSVGQIDGRLTDRITLTDLSFRQQDTAFEARSLTLLWSPWSLTDGLLRIERLQGDDLRLTLAASETPPAIEPPQIPDVALPFAIEVGELALARLVIDSGGQEQRLSNLTLAAQLDAEGLRISDLQLDGFDVRVSGSAGMATQAPHALSGVLSLEVPAPAFGIGAPVAAQLTLSGEALSPALSVAMSRPVAATVAATADLTTLTPQFSAALGWQPFAWPFGSDAPSLRLAEGRVQISGSADDYRLDLSTVLGLEAVGDIGMALQGQGDSGRLTLSPLTLTLLDGTVTVDGQVGWATAPEWQATIRVTQLDPGSVAPEWPGRLNAMLGVDGGLPEPDRPVVRLDLASMDGVLRDYPVSAAGRLMLDGATVRLDGLRLASADNRLTLDGSLDTAGKVPVADLAFRLDAPSLVALHPQLSGSARGTGSLRGALDDPQLALNLGADTLRFDALEIRRLDADIDWGRQNATGEGGRGDVRLQDIDVGGSRFDTLSLQLDGTAATHRARLQLSGEPLAAGLALQGGLAAGGGWAARISQLDLSSPQHPDLGTWALQAPASLQVAEGRVVLGDACLARAPARICQQIRLEGERLAGSGSLQALPLSLLVGLADPGLVVDGELAGDWQLSGTAASPVLKAQLRPTDGQLRLEASGEPPLPIVWRNLLADLSFARDALDLQLSGGFADNGALDAQLGLGPASEDGQRALSGRVNAQLPDLGPYRVLLPEVSRLAGGLTADLRLGGRLDAPTLDGRVALEGGEVDLPLAGLELRAMTVALSGQAGEPLSLSGSVASGGGTLLLSGSIALVDPAAPQLDLSISGKDFVVARLPEVEAAISPELTVRGQAPLVVRGTVQVPRARISLRELPSGSITVSSDEMIVGVPEPEGAQAPGGVDARVRVALGDAVRLSGFGLSTRLGGAVVATVADGESAVDGEIELRDGTFKAYGQDLSIVRGRLVFAGSAANPGIGLRAQRRSRDETVTAYLDVEGDARSPQLRVFSEPALPQAEALSYLLTGAPLSSASAAQGGSIASAALSLGLARSDPVLQGLKDQFGLDELTVDSGSGLDSSALTVGKYLNPDLYIGYTRGLFSAEQALLLRQRLSRRLSLESRSGTSQSVDLIYQFETN